MIPNMAVCPRLFFAAGALLASLSCATAAPAEKSDAPKWKLVSSHPRKGDKTPICEPLLENLNAAAPEERLQNCGVVIQPQYSDRIRKIVWQALDPQQHMRWIWSMDVASRSGTGPVGGDPGHIALRQMSFEEWQAWYADYLRWDGREPILKTARFDLTGDGRIDTVLAYRTLPKGETCDPRSATDPIYSNSDYFLFVLNAKTDEIEFELTRHSIERTPVEPLYVNGQVFMLYSTGPPSEPTIYVYQDDSGEDVDIHDRCEFAIHASSRHKFFDRILPPVEHSRSMPKPVDYLKKANDGDKP